MWVWIWNELQKDPGTSSFCYCCLYGDSFQWALFLYQAAARSSGESHTFSVLQLLPSESPKSSRRWREELFTFGKWKGRTRRWNDSKGGTWSTQRKVELAKMNQGPGWPARDQQSGVEKGLCRLCCKADTAENCWVKTSGLKMLHPNFCYGKRKPDIWSKEFIVC